MSPQTVITEPRPLASQSQRPWRPAPVARRAQGLVVLPFATPVVRELPARREAVSAGTW